MPAPDPVPHPDDDVIGVFHSLAKRVLAIADRGAPRDRFVADALAVFLGETASDRASLRLPGTVGTTTWTLARGQTEPVAPWVEARAAPAAPESRSAAWRRRLPPGASGSTQLGTVWTRRGGLAPLQEIPDDERPPHLRRVGCGPHAASVLLLPVVVGATDVGLLQLESRRENAYDPARSRAYEGATQILGAALVAQQAHWALLERVKELSCLYELARITEDGALDLHQAIERIAALLPPAWQHPASASSRIVLDGHVVTGPGPRPCRATQKAPIVIDGVRRGLVEVGYAGEHRPHDEGPFLKEERKLLDAIAAEIASFVARRAAAEERGRLEDQLRHADRLATIGQLAAGVAHELNEPLGTILGFAQLVQKVPSLPAAAGPDLERIVEAALHARTVVRKLVEFGRQSTSRTEEADLARIVEDSLYFLATQCARSGIALEREVRCRDCVVRVDRSQMHQVVVNLVVNAIQAMPSGGRLVVRAAQDGPDAILEVEDTGIGMTDEVKANLFLPFFTTKDVGEGTGLGLSVVHGIVTSHRGTVDVESTPGKGTRFTVRLPRADAAEQEVS